VSYESVGHDSYEHFKMYKNSKFILNISGRYNILYNKNIGKYNEI